MSFTWYLLGCFINVLILCAEQEHVEQPEPVEQQEMAAEVKSETLNVSPAIVMTTPHVFDTTTDSAVSSLPLQNVASVEILPSTEGKENQPATAVVKPHILTHVIEGYVIQEGPEPFPVSNILTF